MSDSLRSLSDQDILSRIHVLTRREREATLLVLPCLNEIKRRRLYLTLGFQSLYDYCTSGLGYSSSAAYRRIQTARCIALFPGLYDMLQKNEVNLSTVAQVSRVLSPTNHKELLSRIRGKSQREVESIRAEYQPCAMPRDRVRTVVVRVPASSDRFPSQSQRPLLVAASDRGSEAAVQRTDACEKSAYCRNGSEGADRPAGELATVHVEKRVFLQFTVDPAFMEKLNKIKSLASHRLSPNPTLEQIFELLMDAEIERRDPAKRKERREQRATSTMAEHTRNPRYIPARVRDQVFAKHGGQCAFVAPDGRRCNSTHVLQVDHVKPIALGGKSTPGNLRLLCAYHNRLEATRVLGPGAGIVRESVDQNRYVALRDTLADDGGVGMVFL